MMPRYSYNVRFKEHFKSHSAPLRYLFELYFKETQIMNGEERELVVFVCYNHIAFCRRNHITHSTQPSQPLVGRTTFSDSLTSAAASLGK